MAPRGKPIIAKILMHTEYCCIFKEDQVLLVGRMRLQMIFATITLTELLFSLPEYFYRLLLNKHNSTLTMLQLPKPTDLAVVSYCRVLSCTCFTTSH